MQTTPPPTLAELRDIHLPPPPPAWPWPEALVSALFLAFAAFLLWRRHRRNRPQRRASRELSRLERKYAGDGDATALAAGLSQLLRNEAQRLYPAAAVNALVDRQWLEFLDDHGGGNAFRDGCGAVLADLPYRRAGAIDGSALIDLTRNWLRKQRR